jgi:hypothetical protein
LFHKILSVFVNAIFNQGEKNKKMRIFVNENRSSP